MLPLKYQYKSIADIVDNLIQIKTYQKLCPLHANYMNIYIYIDIFNKLHI
jgi:hypothetical protein